MHKNNNMETNIEEIKEESSQKGFIKKNKKIIITLFIFVLVIVGVCVQQEIHSKKTLERIQENTIESLHNSSARKEIIYRDLENFKSIVIEADKKNIPNDEKTLIINDINAIISELERKDTKAQSLRTETTRLSETFSKVTIPLDDETYSEVTQDFNYLFESLILLGRLELEEGEAIYEDILVGLSTSYICYTLQQIPKY